MANFGSLLKSAVVAIVLVVASAHADRLATCCKKVDKNEITEPILGYLIQKENHPCVNAVIFQTGTGLYCSYIKAPWVHRKIKELRRAKAQSKTLSSPSPVSLLSIITSTASPPSPSTMPPSSSSPFFTTDSMLSSGDMFSGNDEDETIMTSTTFW
ncbi:uncharacterized protein V3H82_022198 [Fundulus diaphanus]